MKILFVSLLNLMHFEIRTDRNTVCTDRYSASIPDNPPVGGGGHSRKEWLELCRRPRVRQKLLISLASLRQKTLLFDPDLRCFAYTWHTKLSNFYPKIVKIYRYLGNILLVLGIANVDRSSQVLTLDL